jgi:hypothetical protein
VACTLAAHQPLSRFPSHLLQGQSDHGPGPSAQPGPPEPAGVIALSWRWTAVTAGPQAGAVRGVPKRRQDGYAPVRHGGHGLGQGGGGRSSREPKAAKAPQDRRADRGLGGTLRAGLPSPAVGEVVGASSRTLAGWWAQPAGEQTSDRVAGGRPGRGRQATRLA